MRTERNRRFLVTPLLVLAACVAQPALAEESEMQKRQPNPYTKADGTWISISGVVKNVRPNTFALDYGKGVISVEMDDGDRDADAYALLDGDKVTVNGRIDDDFFQTTTIEASSVFVEKLGTHFFASSIDEEDGYFALDVPVIVARTTVSGKVTAIEGDELVLDTGLRKLRVDVEAMPYDPLDDEGYQKIEVGDVVRVSGTMDPGFFDGRELSADRMITLFDASS